MKFILHNLRMIWSRFRSNGWVLAELFLVFVVMWFLCDSLDRKSTRLNSSHASKSRMPSSA